MKAKLADALLVELRDIYKKIEEVRNGSSKMQDVPQDVKKQRELDRINARDHFPRNMYDGLVSSSKIADFDYGTQEKIRHMYDAVELFKWDISTTVVGNKNYKFTVESELIDSARHNTSEAVRKVEVFRDRNRYRGRWLRLLKILRLEYED